MPAATLLGLKVTTPSLPIYWTAAITWLASYSSTRKPISSIAPNPFFWRRVRKWKGESDADGNSWQREQESKLLGRRQHPVSSCSCAVGCAQQPRHKVGRTPVRFCSVSVPGLEPHTRDMPYAYRVYSRAYPTKHLPRTRCRIRGTKGQQYDPKAPPPPPPRPLLSRPPSSNSRALGS